MTDNLWVAFMYSEENDFTLLDWDIYIAESPHLAEAEGVILGSTQKSRVFWFIRPDGGDLQALVLRQKLCQWTNNLKEHT